jgi:IS5 family transposase
VVDFEEEIPDSITICRFRNILISMDLLEVDREEESDAVVYEASDVQMSADKDARWLKKGKRSFFGYKSFVTVGAEQGYVERVAVTPANVSESRSRESQLKNMQKVAKFPRSFASFQ